MREITDEHDVVVIGAGAAGIAATRRLVEAGVDVLLLEACNRAGGRAFSVRQGEGAAIDLGCGWLHSADVNPWTAIAAALGFEIDRTLPPWQDDTHNLGMSPAHRRAFRKASTRFWETFETGTASIPDQPAAGYLEPGNPWNSLINATSTYINGAELACVSALDFARYADTHINWRVPAGYGTLIARYSAGLPIVLGCKVIRIDHSGAAIRIETGDGILRARAVIVTVSTNVLAGGAIRFTPDIPDVRDAAAHLPLGHAEKVFLTLDDAAEFPKDARFFGAADRAATGAYHMRPFGRPMIEAYFGASLARDLQTAGKAAMIAFACEEIAAVLGAAIIARLRPLGASGWAGDPLILGSYSHAEPGRANARPVLSTPIQNRIFFAGEACSIHDFSTAHGAYKTGIAAAEASLAQNKPTAK
ncbi:MAG: flavin monoamine oxidase family protein [Methylocella sp.]